MKYSNTEVICIVAASMLAVILTISVGLCAPASGKKKISGKDLFQQRCASCHAGGGNRVEPARTLTGSKELASIESFKEYLGKPPGHMPYYEDVVKDPAMLKKLYEYCKTLKTLPVKQAAKSTNVN